MITLEDGRRLGIVELGDPSGPAVLYFHGFPGSALEANLVAEAARRCRVRLIGIDRPGIGRSSPLSHRRVLGWPDDVVHLADQLQIDRFSVLGFSGGAPYALACAVRMPDRLDCCGIVSGVGPSGLVRRLLSQTLPWLTMPMLQRRFATPEASAQTLQGLSKKWPPADRRCLEHASARDALASSLAEAFRQGARGSAKEATLLGGDWKFRLEAIAFPRILLWHGAEDRQVTLATAKDMATRLPHCRATYIPGEGHISLLVNHGQSILEALAAPSS